MGTGEIMAQAAALAEAANFLNDSTSVIQLNRMVESLRNGNLFVSVMGQFSAGKSRLINNLLGKKVLPVHITETTALITMISYSEDEHAELLMSDSSIKRYSLEEALDLWQSGKASPELEKADTLHLFVDNALLKNGLIIADTPGINTMIKRHVELSANIVGNSDTVLYVMGKSITETDVNFVNSIRENGVGVTFVRTHMDELKSAEEDANSTVAKERTALEEYTDNGIFFVSNEESCKYFYSNIDDLRDWITNKLANNVEAAVNKTAKARIAFLAEKFDKLLLEKKAALEALVNGKKDEFYSQKSKIESALEGMENILNSNKKRLKEKMEQTKRQAETNTRDNCEIVAKNAGREIQKVSGTEYYDYIERAQSLVNKSCAELRKTYLNHFEKVITDNNVELGKALSGKEGVINIKVEVPETLENARYEFSEIAEERAALTALCDDIQAELKALSDESESTAAEEQELEKRKQKLAAALEKADKALNEYPDYEEQYVEVQQATHGAEKGWRIAGKVLDLAAFFIPGDVMLKGVGKVLGAGSKVLKTGGKAAKVVTEASQLAKTAKAIDTAADTTKVINTLSKVVSSKNEIKSLEKRLKNQAKESSKAAVTLAKSFDKVRGDINDLKESEDKPTFFDYLTIEHWFGQIGKKFDKPQVLEVDRGYEKKYKHDKMLLQKQLEKAAYEESENTIRLLDIKDKKKKQELREEKLRKKLANNKAKFDELDRNEEIERRKAQEKAIKDYYSNETENKIREYCDFLMTNGSAEVDELINCYIGSYDYSICSQISKKRAELAELEKSYNNGSREKAERELADCRQHIKAVEDVLGSVNV